MLEFDGNLTDDQFSDDELDFPAELNDEYFSDTS